MLTIQGEHGSYDGDDSLFEMRLRDTHLRQEMLSGPCEDDCEVTAPYVGACPDESSHQDGSPLSFGGITPAEDRAFAEGMEQFMAAGFDYSMNASICTQAHANGRDPYLSFDGDYGKDNPTPIGLYRDPYTGNLLGDTRGTQTLREPGKQHCNGCSTCYP